MINSAAPSRQPLYHKTYQQKWRLTEAGKKSQRERQRRERLRKKLACIEALGGKCIRCGWNEHPWGFDFDHIDSKKKQHDPARILYAKGLNIALKYIKGNCQLLCANCHALKTIVFQDHVKYRKHRTTQPGAKELWESQMP